MPTLKSSIVTLLTVFGQAALAVPTADAAVAPSNDFMKGLDTSDWVSVQFQGKTITYNPTIFNASASGGALQSASIVSPAWTAEDRCGPSSFGGTDPPWAHDGDCAAIRDWAYAQHKTFYVWNATPDYHGIVFAGTCAFGAGTRNVFNTEIGSSDIGDLTRDGIRDFAHNGLVGAAGNMGCCNSNSCNDGFNSNVFWKLQCNGC